METPGLICNPSDMKFFALSLSLLTTTSWAANNSAGYRPQTDVELETLSRKLQMYVHFDSKYFTDLETKRVSIEVASQMSIDELNKLESSSRDSVIKAKSDNALCEEFVHAANLELAKLFQLAERLDVPTFDAWKNSRFAGVKFMDVAREAIKHNPEYVKLLAEYASKWHLENAHQLKRTERHSQEANSHFAHNSSINFICHGLTTLNESDSAEFDKCITNESLDGIRGLAKKITTSNQYSRDIFSEIVATTSNVSEIAEDNKIALMADCFINEILVACVGENHEIIQAQLRKHRITFNMKSAIDSKEPKKAYRAYQKCILKAAGSAEIKNLCVDAFFQICGISKCLKTLEDLANKFNGTAENEYSLILRDVVEPTIILINSKRVLENLDNDDLLSTHPSNHGREPRIDSYEKAMKKISTLEFEKSELRNRLLLVQKSRDYLKHKKDIAYIRNTYDGVINEYRNYDRSRAFDIVRKAVQELEKDSQIQKCCFDFDRGMLTSQNPDMLEILLEIQQNKHACSILIDFCENLSVMKSIPFALAYFEEQANAEAISFKTIFMEVNSLNCFEVKSY